MDTSTPTPPGPSDWIEQKTVAQLLGISPQSASDRAHRGELRQFEHGVASVGRRKYSRTLVEREIESRWREAIQRQDELLSSGRGVSGQAQGS